MSKARGASPMRKAQRTAPDFKTSEYQRNHIKRLNKQKKRV